MRPIRAEALCDLERGLFPWINSRDIPLALDDGVLENSPGQLALNTGRLHYSEALQYHRQLFFWRLYPLLWALSRTVTPHATLQTPRLETGN